VKANMSQLNFTTQYNIEKRNNKDTKHNTVKRNYTTRPKLILNQFYECFELERPYSRCLAPPPETLQATWAAGAKSKR